MLTGLEAEVIPSRHPYASHPPMLNHGPADRGTGLRLHYSWHDQAQGGPKSRMKFVRGSPWRCKFLAEERGVQLAV